MTDFSKTKVRCSCLYNIMASARGRSPKQRWEIACADLAEKQAKYDLIPIDKQSLKSSVTLADKIAAIKADLPALEACKDDEELSVGAKTYLASLYAWEKYRKWSVTKERGNKYTAKGKAAEDDSIELISKLDGIIYIKNEEPVENEFFTGTPDLFLGESITNAEYIIDIKSPWDAETFFANLGKPLNPRYWWQIQGYLALSGAQVGEVSFCLVDVPEAILNQELERLARKLDCATLENAEYKYQAAELIHNLTFKDMPLEDKRIKFIVQRDDEAIERAKKKVQKCREHLIEIENLHKIGKFDAKLVDLPQNDAE